MVAKVVCCWDVLSSCQAVVYVVAKGFALLADFFYSVIVAWVLWEYCGWLAK